MADETAFQVIRDAIFNATINHPGTAAREGREEGYAPNADAYARAVLIALEHSGFEIVRHTPEPPDDD